MTNENSDRIKYDVPLLFACLAIELATDKPTSFPLDNRTLRLAEDLRKVHKSKVQGNSENGDE